MSPLAPSPNTPTLYTYAESGNSYKVRLLASLLNITLEEREVDFPNSQQRSPEFLAINPRGEVPTLVDGSHTFTDSAAILTYLAGTYPNPDRGSGSNSNTTTPSSYWSADAIEQAKIIDWLAFAASWIQSGICTARTIFSFEAMYTGLGSASTLQTLKEAQVRAHKSLEVLDSHFGGGEKWLVLGRPTIADVAIFAYVALAPMGDVGLEGYENVRRWIGDVKGLEGFVAMKGLEDPLYRRRGFS
jgi:glutathione S-transferase